MTKYFPLPSENSTDPAFRWKKFSRSKIIPPPLIEEKVAALKKEGKTIATLNGSFDLLHAGHLFILFEAAQVADVLFVAVNSDASVKKYKSIDRPIIPLEYRLEMLSAISFIDYLTWFEETDPRELLKKIAPHVHVNGQEYGENCIEKETVVAGGGRIHLVPRIDGLSTSQVIKKIKNLT